MDINWESSAIGNIAVVITCVIAALALWSSSRDSRARVRPYVVAEYRVPDSAFALIFVVRNAGQSVARDVEVSFSPEIGDPVAQELATRGMLKTRYGRRISYLAPGQELVNAIKQNLKDPDDSDLPLDVTVTVTYRRDWLRRYKESFRLESEVYAQHTYTEKSDSPKASLKTIAKQTTAIHKDLVDIRRDAADRDARSID